MAMPDTVTPRMTKEEHERGIREAEKLMDRLTRKSFKEKLRSWVKAFFTLRGNRF